ncbi:hypothetical protein FRC02_008776 [Tulasnella sp. 418]|nr:hypothetical protein FRC02_008776 [Tulasnella sp. 418]
MIVQEDRSDSNYEPISSLITLNREEILQITHTSPSSVGQLTPDPGDDFNRAVPYQEDADDEKDENFCGENGESIWDNDIADVTAGVGLALSPPVLTTRMNRDLILQISSSSSDSDEDQQSGHVAIQGPGSSHEIGRLEQSQPVSRQPVPHPRESCNHSRTGLILQISSSSSDSDEDQQSGHVAIQGPGSSHEIGRLEQSQPVSRQPVPRDVVYPNTDPQRMSSFLPTRDPLDKM